MVSYSKLAELRAKTDRELISVITRRLDAGLDFAANAMHFQAERAHLEARRLLPWVNATQAERRHLESKLQRLSNALEDCATGTGLRVRTACS